MTIEIDRDKRKKIVGTQVITTPSEQQRQTLDNLLKRKPPKTKIKVR